MVQGVSGKRRLLEIFQYGCENSLASNRLTVVTVDWIPCLKNEVPTIYAMPDETVFWISDNIMVSIFSEV